MALDPFIDSVDDLPEDLRGHYVEREGKFYLEVAARDGWALEDVGALKRALATQKETRRKAEERLKLFGDLDPDEALEAIESKAKYAEMDPDKFEERFQVRERELLSKAKKDLDKVAGERDQQIAELTKQLEDVLIDNQARQSIATLKGAPELLIPIVKSHSQMRRREDGTREVVVIDGPGGAPRISPTDHNRNMTITEYVDELKKTEAYARAFDGTGSSGSGSTPSGNAPAPGRSGVMTIKGSDQEAINRHWKEIAVGKAVVVDD